MEKDNWIDEAVDMLFKEDKDGNYWICAEVAAFYTAKNLGDEKTKEMAEFLRRTATIFGNGMGDRNGICGCITGALIGIGNMYGRTKTSDEKNYEISMGLIQRVKERLEKLGINSLICKDIRVLDDNDTDCEKINDELCKKVMKTTLDEMRKIMLETNREV